MSKTFVKFCMSTDKMNHFEKDPYQWVYAKKDTYEMTYLYAYIPCYVCECCEPIV